MKLLDEELEETLSELILCSKKEYGGVIRNRQGFDLCKIAALIQQGYCKNSAIHRENIVLTHKGKRYFRDKEIYERQLKKEKTVENMRYWITTAIAIAALIVSIISISR